MPRIHVSAACLLLCGFGLGALWAHDLYLRPESFRTHKGARLQVSFHNGDSFPVSEVAPRPDRLHEASLAGAGGKAAVTGLHIVGSETVGVVEVPASGTLLLSVHTAPNFIELEPGKFNDYLKEEGLTDVVAWRTSHEELGMPGRERYSKYSKSLIESDRADDYYGHSFDFPLEIVPLADPDGLHARSTLPVRVTHLGKPVAGVQVEASWAAQGKSRNGVVGRTGEDGSIRIPLGDAGLWRLHALTMERCADSAVADWESSWASLTFEIR